VHQPVLEIDLQFRILEAADTGTSICDNSAHMNAIHESPPAAA
jgi:hypothetical protein